jgi:hypothetical protein
VLVQLVHMLQLLTKETTTQIQVIVYHNNLSKAEHILCFTLSSIHDVPLLTAQHGSPNKILLVCCVFRFRNQITVRNIPFSKFLHFKCSKIQRIFIFLMMLFFWIVTPCGLIGRYQCFRETYCLHLRGWSRGAGKWIVYMGSEEGLG